LGEVPQQQRITDIITRMHYNFERGRGRWRPGEEYYNF
jgi:hypothetical protein